MNTATVVNRRGRDVTIRYRTQSGLRRQLSKLGIIPLGKIIGYKKVCDVAGYPSQGTSIVKLEIPASARRTKDVHRNEGKMRASHARVLSGEGHSWKRVYNALKGVHEGVHYVKGTTVKAYAYDPSLDETCAGGIHFYLTRREAVNHTF